MDDFEMIGSINSNQDKENERLQRTEEWFEARKGRYTGSRIKYLMGCGRSTSKLPWGSLEKTFDFGALAERYIYNVGKERITGLRSMEISSKQMEWGKQHEDLLVERLIKDGLITDFKELGFEIYSGYKNIGASADGEANYKNEVVGIELKCCVSWDGNYNRMYEKVHEKHNDFWQFQTEMLSTGRKKILYVVTHPLTVDSYDYDIVCASEIHQKEMVRRAKIADKAISLWDGHNYKHSLELACAYYKENEIN
ncbi:MAG: YqaJ viral recombinase family protein [Vicingaceae bacterium]